MSLPFSQRTFYTVLTNSEVLVMIGHLTIQVFWDVIMCGRFRSAAMQHRITGCCLNKTTVETSQAVLTICHCRSSSNILNDCVAFIFSFSCLIALPWGVRHYNPLKHHEILTQRHHVTYQKTQFFSNTAAITSNPFFNEPAYLNCPKGTE